MGGVTVDTEGYLLRGGGIAKVLVCSGSEKGSEAVLGVWFPAPLPTSRAPPDRGALWPLA